MRIKQYLNWLLIPNYLHVQRYIRTAEAVLTLKRFIGVAKKNKLIQQALDGGRILWILGTGTFYYVNSGY